MGHATKSPSDQQRRGAAGRRAAAPGAAATLVDNRRAVAHPELAVAVSGSPNVIAQQASLRVAFSPRVLVQGKRLEGMFGNALQRRSESGHVSHRPEAGAMQPPLPRALVPSGPLRTADVLALQRTIANRGVRWISHSLPTAQQFEEGIVLGQHEPQFAQLDAIRTALGRYAAAQAKDFQPKLRLLRQIDTALYAWFDAVKGPTLPEDARGQYMRTLMQESEKEHEKVVDALQFAPEVILPVDETGLTGEEKGAIRKLWIDILEGKSNIKVRTGTKFSRRILAQIAKLLQGPAGRELIALLSTPQQDPARQIRILAELPEGVETMPGSFAKPIEEPRPWETAAEWAFGAPVIKDEDVLKEEKDQSAKDVDYPVAASAAELNQAIFKRATKGVTLGGTKYRFGAGQGSYVRMASGDEPMVDRGLNAIASPGFVTLGHELGHALRNLHGGSLKDPMLYGDKAQALGLAGDASLDKELWSDIEEFVNITQTENALRAEHGLTARSYHDVKARATIARFQLNARYLSIVREAPVDVRSALTNASETLAKELRGASSVDFGMAQILDQKQREVDEFEQRVPSLVNRARRIKDLATRHRQVFGGPVGPVKSKLGSARDVLDVVNRIEGILIASIGRSEEEEAGVARDVEWLESQRERITQLITPKEAT